MSFEDTRKAIYEHFATQWAAGTYNAVPVVYEGQPRKNANGEDLELLDEAWVTLTIVWGGGYQATLGEKPLDRYAGVIMVQIFTREYTGTSTANLMADVVAGIFLRRQLEKNGSGRILCGVPYPASRSTQNGWLQTNINVPFERDVIN